MEATLSKMKTLYELALQDEAAYPNVTYMYKGEELKITDSVGTRTVYEIFGNEERHRFDSKNIAVEYLNDKGYFYDSAGSYYPVSVYINPQKNKEYSEAYNATKEHNENILNARRELLSSFIEYLADNYPVCYVRFGEIPNDGKSYNTRDEYFEDGVSVFKAYNVNDVYVIDIV
jgi:hypothetical protein